MSVALTEEGPRLVALAQEADLPLRLFGGVAIWLRCSEQSRTVLGREYGDLDFVAHSSSSRRLRELLERENYLPERTFNATHGASRLLYNAPDGEFHIDVFLDRFEMSHKLDVGRRLEMEPLCLPAAELLLAKLQVAQINRKDLTDATMLLIDHEPTGSDGPGRLNIHEVSRTCARDWGLFTTVSDNLVALERILPELALVDDQLATVSDRAKRVRDAMEAQPKNTAWKVRARVGRRVRWYEVPEEVTR